MVSISPLKQILDIRRDELPQSLLMSSYFFLVITVFWILKPLKKGLFVQFYDQTAFDLFGWSLDAAQAELIAKVFNMVVAFGAATTFVYLSRSLRRQQLTERQCRSRFCEEALRADRSGWSRRRCFRFDYAGWLDRVAFPRRLDMGLSGDDAGHRGACRGRGKAVRAKRCTGTR